MGTIQIVSISGLAAASAVNVAASQTPTSGTKLTINGSAASGGVATLDQGRRVLLTYGNEASARTMLITGTNQTGNVISETLAVPSGSSGTVATKQDFLTVTSALPAGGGWTAAVTIGTNGVASSPWKNISYHLSPVNLGIACVVTGTANYTVEYTYDNPNGTKWNFNQPILVIPTPFAHALLQAQTTTMQGNITTPFWGWRLTINSGATSGSGVTATGIPAGIEG